MIITVKFDVLTVVLQGSLPHDVWRRAVWYIIINLSEESPNFIFSVPLYPDDGGTMFLRNVRNNLQDYMVSHSKDNDLRDHKQLPEQEFDGKR